MSEPDEVQWYYLDPLNQVVGPHSAGMMEALLQDIGDCPVTRAGLQGWVSASLLPEFRPLFPEQPEEPGRDGTFARGFLKTRSLDEMLGLCKGVLADGVIVEREAIALEEWCRANPELATEWPASILGERLRRIFEDGIVDDEERADLGALLRQIVGGPPEASLCDRYATTLPLDNPAPAVRIRGSYFVFTGKFLYGQRRVCMAAVDVRGGTSQKYLTGSTNYLVVGTMATEAWAHGSFGRKLESALASRERYGTPAIICEQHWVKYLA